jgi:hypothetical protein
MDPLGTCPRNLRHCYSCDNSLGSSIIPNPPFGSSGKPQEWWKTLQCNNCSNRWFVCTECSDSRSHIKGFHALKLHFSRYHDNRKSKARSKSRSTKTKQQITSTTYTGQEPKKKKSVEAQAFPFSACLGNEVIDPTQEDQTQDTHSPPPLSR